MTIQIRKATLKDIDLLIEWRIEVLRDVFSLSADDELSELKEENRSYYMDAIPKEGHIACFAYVDDEIIGCGGLCLYREMPSPDNLSGQCAYLMNIYTRKAFRNQGVGRNISQWLIEQAQERNISKIYLEASKQGRFLYSSMGFEDMPGYMKWIRKQ